jgi:hypothetical protein
MENEPVGIVISAQLTFDPIDCCTLVFIVLPFVCYVGCSAPSSVTSMLARFIGESVGTIVL